MVLPGQEAGAEDLEEGVKYPSMQELGEDLVSVLDQLGLEWVVGLGEGAGANILARFSKQNDQDFSNSIQVRNGSAHAVSGPHPRAPYLHPGRGHGAVQGDPLCSWNTLD